MMTSSSDDKQHGRHRGEPGAAIEGGETTTDGNVVVVDGLVVRKARREILRGLDLSLPRGSITGLFGPSGCGKTTLMRSIVGVQRIHGGRISVLGAKPGSKRLRSELGYVTQAAAVYKDLTLVQNLRYFAALYGAGEQKIKDTIATVGLTGHDRQKVASMSGGQASRVSLACALVADPQLLVLDEPTVGLDPVTREDLWRHFRAVATEGTTILVSSHVMDEAGHCDRLVLMRQGQILRRTTPTDLLEATGTDSYDSAFLTVINQADAAEGATSGEAA